MSLISQIVLSDEEFETVHAFTQSPMPGHHTIQAFYGQIVRTNAAFRRFGGWKVPRDAYI